MQELLHAVINGPLGVVGGLFVSVLVGYLVLRFFADNLKWLVVAGIALFFLVANLGLFGGAATPPGEVGSVLRVGEIGFEAQDEYGRCIARTVSAESPQSRALAAASQACTAQAHAQVRACVEASEGKFWILDKLHHCQGKAAPDWADCGRRALAQHASDASSALRCDRWRQVGIMQKVAGMVANLGGGTGGGSASLAYDTECLRGVFNANLQAMPQRHCEQQRELPAWQQCVAESIESGLGAAGTRAVAACATAGSP